MPLVTLTTNLSDNILPSDLNQSIIEFLAVLFNIPTFDFSVVVDAGKWFTIGGTSEPAVMLVIKSIINYNETVNIKYAKEISEFVQKNVGVGYDRCVIHFFPFETFEVSSFGTTVQELPSTQAYPYMIKEGATEHSYETIFKRCIDSNLTEIIIYDPFVYKNYQIKNLGEFIRDVTKLAKNLKKIKLFTTKPHCISEQKQQKLDFANFKHISKRITFKYEFKQFHYRKFVFNNGWVVKNDRGLDLFKPPERINNIEEHKQGLRKCKTTDFTYLYVK